MIACSAYQITTTRETVNWYNHFEKFLNNVYIKTLKMFTI